MNTRSILAPVLAGLVSLTGCSNFEDLLIQESDSAGAVTGKVAGRVLLCAVTICISEMGLAQEQYRIEEKAKREQRLQMFTSFMDSQIGRMTFREAVAKWGAPVRELDRNGAFLAVWQSRALDPGYLLVPPLAGAYSPAVALPLPNPGWELVLGFDKRTQRLTSWSYRSW